MALKPPFAAVLITLVLILAPTFIVAPASAASDAGTGLGAKWTEMKTAIAAGNVTAARAIYDASFARGAGNDTQARATILDAFAVLDSERANTSSLLYIAHAQLVDKGTYAVAYASVKHALRAHAIADASAWMDVLFTKFPAATDLSASKVAFHDLANANLTKVAASLAVEYNDLLHAKVMKESRGAAALINLNPGAAAAEAGEALGYYLSLSADLASRGGADSRARSALSGLLRAALRTNATDASTEAATVIDIIARDAIVTNTPRFATPYAAFLAALANDEFDNASAIYAASFANVSGGTDARVARGFADARAAHGNAKAHGGAIARETLEKAALEIAFLAFTNAARSGDADTALAAFLVLGEKFDWITRETPAFKAIARAAATDQIADADAEAATDLAVDAFVSKVREELSEALIDWDDADTSAIKAREATAYAAPILALVADRLNEGSADELAHALEDLESATKARNKTAASSAVRRAEIILIQFESGTTVISDKTALIASLAGKLALVVDEYDTAVTSTDADEAARELAEARAFLASAEEQFNANRATFADLNASVLAQVDADFARMRTILEEKSDMGELRVLAARQLARIRGVSDSVPDKPATPPVDADEVRITLGDAGASGVTTITIPVTIAGLPQDGSAYQFSVTYDRSVLEATRVGVFFGDVKASNIDDVKGRVRFNGASTGAALPLEKVAEITFNVRGTPTGKSVLVLEIEDLLDGQSKPLQATTIMGGTIDFDAAPTSTARIGGDEARPTPMPLASVVVGIIVGVALLTGRRSEGRQ